MLTPAPAQHSTAGDRVRAALTPSVRRDFATMHLCHSLYPKPPLYLVTTMALIHRLVELSETTYASDKWELIPVLFTFLAMFALVHGFRGSMPQHQ